MNASLEAFIVLTIDSINWAKTGTGLRQKSRIQHFELQPHYTDCRTANVLSLCAHVSCQSCVNSLKFLWQASLALWTACQELLTSMSSINWAQHTVLDLTWEEFVQQIMGWCVLCRRFKGRPYTRHLNPHPYCLFEWRKPHHSPYWSWFFWSPLCQGWQWSG